jgi:hypothetical protein
VGKGIDVEVDVGLLDGGVHVIGVLPDEGEGWSRMLVGPAEAFSQGSREKGAPP